MSSAEDRALCCCALRLIRFNGPIGPVYINPLDVSLLRELGQDETSIIMRSGEGPLRIVHLDEPIEDVAARLVDG